MPFSSSKGHLNSLVCGPFLHLQSASLEPLLLSSNLLFLPLILLLPSHKDCRDHWAQVNNPVSSPHFKSLNHSLKSPLLCVCCCSVTHLCPTLWDPMDCSTAALPCVLHLPQAPFTTSQSFCCVTYIFAGSGDWDVDILGSPLFCTRWSGPEPTAPVSAGNLLETQILSPYPRSTGSETLVRPSNLCYSKPSRWFWCILNHLWDTAQECGKRQSRCRGFMSRWTSWGQRISRAKQHRWNQEHGAPGVKYCITGKFLCPNMNLMVFLHISQNKILNWTSP